MLKQLTYLLWVPAVLLLTGCPSPPKPPPQVTPILPVPQPVPVPPAAPTVLPSEPAQPVIVQPAPPSQVAVPLDRWIAWEDWNRQLGFEKPRRVSSTSSPTFESKLANGLLAVTIGSRMASWNGLALTLGFVPQLTNGQPYIHGLDVAKNFQPLLFPPSLAQKGSRVIVIDPGHGGDSTGARSVASTAFEKDYSLDWARRLAPLLSANGWKVFLTRNRDVNLSLADRVAFAENMKADLFLSLHFNSIDGNSNRTEHGGIETYCLTPVGMPSFLTRDYVDNLTQVFRNNAFDAQNLHYAVRLHQSLIQTTQRRDRGVRRARFMAVLRGQNRPAVLLEGGYLSDAEEARLIASSEYRQKLAEAVAKALAE